jgi:peptidoglycan lytic transglycosylase
MQTTQIGLASWYGKEFNGRRTASGERFDMNALTCANRTLPLGTLLKVTNLRTGKWIIIRVNDRGPVSPKILIDLSYGAAKELDLLGNGRVRIEKYGNNS